MSTDPIAVADNYLGLIAALRARAAELDIPYETIDAIAGWTPSYTSKLLTEEPVKFLGPMSFDAILGTLAVKLVIIRDPAKLEKLKQFGDYTTHKIRMRGPVSNPYVVRRDTREHMRLMGKKGGKARWKDVPPRKRKSIARKAALARWRKPKLTEITGR